jgi:hypothetical protein
MAEYFILAVTQLRAAGRVIEDETLVHIWPIHLEDINLYGSITVDAASWPSLPPTATGRCVRPWSIGACVP